MKSTTDPNDKSTIYQILENVTDPEIPVISIRDLGILRDVKIGNEQVEVIITPTYSGCPAMLAIEKDINNVLKSNGVNDFKITTVLSPAWTTDWMTEEGKKKLYDYGIAPPNPSNENEINCPNCNSLDVDPFVVNDSKIVFKCESK